MINYFSFHIGIILLNFAFSKSSTISSDERVVGGYDVPKGIYIPYQVSLQFMDRNGKYQHFCGGSIIANNTILTAAHCCQSLSVQRIIVLAGVRDLNDVKGIRSKAVSCHIHSAFKPFKGSDIAVIRIQPPFVLNNISIASIDVTNRDLVPGNVEVTLTGWGLRLPLPLPLPFDILQTISYPNIMQKMSYRTLTNQECRDKGVTELTNTEICAQVQLFKGACSGDSGGPLVITNEEGQYQVGIVSYGLFVCGVFDVPDVYTRVSEFTNWLESYIS